MVFKAKLYSSVTILGYITWYFFFQFSAFCWVIFHLFFPGQPIPAAQDQAALILAEVPQFVHDAQLSYDEFIESPGEFLQGGSLGGEGWLVDGLQISWLMMVNDG